MLVMVRFWSKVNKTDDCWLWTGTTRTSRGNHRAIFKVDGIWEYAARFIWEQLHSPIPEGIQILHECDNPICVKPSHLWEGTQLENIADMKHKGRARGPGGKNKRIGLC